MTLRAGVNLSACFTFAPSVLSEGVWKDSAASNHGAVAVARILRDKLGYTKPARHCQPFAKGATHPQA